MIRLTINCTTRSCKYCGLKLKAGMGKVLQIKPRDKDEPLLLCDRCMSRIVEGFHADKHRTNSCSRTHIALSYILGKYRMCWECESSIKPSELHIVFSEISSIYICRQCFFNGMASVSDPTTEDKLIQGCGLSDKELDVLLLNLRRMS